MIRKAKPEDFDALFSLIKEFYLEVMKDFGIGFDEETVRERIKTFAVDTPNICCFVVEKSNKIIGFFSGLLTGLMFNKNVSAFIEVAYFIKKEYRKGGYGLRLIRHVTRYCKEKGIQKFLVGNTGMVDDLRYRKFYERLGFRLFEQHFIKTI